VVVHCVTERRARGMREAIGRRLADIGLELHPDKTRIVFVNMKAGGRARWRTRRLQISTR